MLDTIDRLQFAHLPTPLDEAPRLAQYLGCSKFYFKRDDLTGLALGGNKVRKLEYDLAEAVRRHCDVILTVGGIQSNHARLTAAAARRLGLDAKLVLGGRRFTEYQGNLLLDVILGAELRILQDNDDNDDLAAAMHAWVEELKAQGRNPYPVPLGGSTALGALGYVRAMRELAGQFGNEPVQIVLAVGSCGTLAGTVLGCKLFLPKARVVGISVSRTAGEIAQRTAELAQETAVLLKTPVDITHAHIESYDTYHEEYGVPTKAGQEAILTCARLESILLDQIYTGKAMSGLFDLTARRVLDPATPIVFLHTGGTPGLFAFEPEFHDLARCTLM